MEITRSESRRSERGHPAHFTGSVRLDRIIRAPDPARVAAALVTFEPGARTAWHTHRLGQTLSIVSGVGRVQREGGSVEEVRPGDIVWIPPGERHWHGATPTTPMSHIAIHERLDGAAVDWLRLVSDEEYGG